MDLRIICVGDELLSGDTLNTNLLYIGDKLACAGLRLRKEVCVPDDEALLRQALSENREADVVLLVGGLGPTRDDLTRPTVASFLNRPLSVDNEVRDGIAKYLGQRARVMPGEAMETQAQVPQGAVVLPNRNGTAPGLLVEDECTLWFLLPGPPREMKPMFDEQVLPRILAKGLPEWDERSLRVVGVGESIVEKTVRDALGKDADVLHLAFCIKNDNVMVKLSKPHGDGAVDLDGGYARVLEAFGPRRIPADCGSAAEYLGHILKERGLTISTAESCTGGGIAAAITDIAGSSEWFTGAFVTYSNEWKTRQLGVSEVTLGKYGAVSPQTVCQMLDGLLEGGGADLGIAVSGIAGPGGGTPDKPVGTVYVGIAGNGWRIIRRMHFNGLRDTVRMRTSNAAINMMIDKILSI